MLLALGGTLCSADPAVLATVAVDARGKFPDVDGDAALMPHLQQNVDDHDVECARSCQSFFCGPSAPFEAPKLSTYSMGPVPSNDLPSAFEG